MRFYTFPPSGVQWPYWLCNPNNVKALRHPPEHAILDPGVEFFLDHPEVTEYPKGFYARYVHTARQFTQIAKDRLWTTIPDYMDDYNPGQFGNNIARTLSNIADFLPFEGVNWLPSIQARYLDLLSFHESCHATRKLVGNYPQVAIGTVCKTNKLSFIEECIKIARYYFPKSHIHAFGLTLRAYPRVVENLDSFDSNAYTFPRGRGKGTAKNLAERRQLFHDYVARVKELSLGLVRNTRK